MNIMEEVNANQKLMDEFAGKMKFLLDNGYDITRIAAELKKGGLDARTVTKDEVEAVKSGTPLAEGFIDAAEKVAMHVINGIALLITSGMAGVGGIIIAYGPNAAAGACGLLIGAAGLAGAIGILGVIKHDIEYGRAARLWDYN